MLLGKRKSDHGGGQYAPPGGKLEYMESFEDCAKREIYEETGIEIINIQFLCLTNLKAYKPRHWINVGVKADWKEGEPKVMEPEKSEEWKWYDLDNLPEPLFAVIPNYVEALKTGRKYFDA